MSYSKVGSLRPRQERIRNGIIDSAQSSFLAHGYGVGMQVIADEASVSRTTLYKYFGDKESIFRATSDMLFARTMRRVGSVQEHGSLRETLVAYGENYAKMILDEEIVDFSRIAYSGLKDFPDLGKMMYLSGLYTFQPVLARYFVDMIAKGEMRKIAPERTAEIFLASCTGHSRQRILYGFKADSWDEVHKYILYAAEIFALGLSPTP